MKVRAYYTYIILTHCMKNNIFIKTLNVNIIIFEIFRVCPKYHIFRKTKIKENIIFSIISDIFRNKSIKQDNDKKEKTKIRGLNNLPRR